MQPEFYDWRGVDEDSGKVHDRMIKWAEAVGTEHGYLYERFDRLGWFYDPNRDAKEEGHGDRRGGRNALVQENVIADNCDSITGVMASESVRSRFMTDGAEWSEQRRAHYLELYVEAVGKLLDKKTHMERGCHAASLKGTGLTFLGRTKFTFNKLVAETFQVDELVVDPRAANGGEAPQLARARLVSRERLIAAYPEHADKIRQLRAGGRGASWAYWAQRRMVGHDDIVFMEGWCLPMGEEGDEGYTPGRYCACVDGIDLECKPYKKAWFPIARMVWMPRPDGWHGIGGGERIVGHQRALDRLNLQIDRQLQQHAFPTTWFHTSDANLAVKTINEFGTCGTYRVKMPQTVFPPAVHPEVLARREAVRASSYESFGQSRMAATAMKPSGLDSGAALREYKDQTTDRFAMPEVEFERMNLRFDFLVLDACKDMAAEGLQPPEVSVKTRRGRRRLDWSQVDPGELRVQMVAASDLSRTPAGRTQLTMEFAQAGIISTDEARRLLQHPDLERAISLHTAALEYIEFCLEDILDGERVVPSMHMNLKMCVWRGEAQYQLAAMDGAPERVLENLHTFIVLAAYQLSVANSNVQAGAQSAGIAPDASLALPGGAPAGPALPPGSPGDVMAGAGVAPLAMAG